MQNSHALCDLGLLITKLLGNEPVDFKALTKSVSLPEQLYKMLETKDESKEVIIRFFITFATFLR